MIDVKVSAWAVAAAVLWALSVCVVAASFLWPVANVGLLLAVASMTVTVRYWVGRQSEQIRNAYQIGRDTGRMEAEGVRRVH